MAMSILSTSSVDPSGFDDANTCKAKRTKCPGVRVIGSRIYDSDQGKSCHQCRQKTRDFTASCKNMGKNKPCPSMFCHKCLLNRYGESAEEVALLDDWKCPKCRGNCNCSICMKKRGQKPTGILVHTAKATGFSSVSEMIRVKGPIVGCQRIPKSICKSPKRCIVSDEGKRGKENSYDQNGELGMCFQKPAVSSTEKSNKTKQKEMNKLCNGNKDCRNNSKKVDKTEAQTKGGKRASSQKKNASTVMTKEEKPKGEILSEVHKDERLPNVMEKEDVKAKPSQLLESVKAEKFPTSIQNEQNSYSISLPKGTRLTTVAGIELPAEDVGHALQFLQFCEAFGEFLDVKKGHAEAVIRELMRRSHSRRSCSGGQYSSSVQFHIQLLSLIQEDSGENSPTLSPTNGKNSWLQAFGDCISNSQSVIRQLSLNCLNSDADDGYQNLDFSKKLQLLNFLCDEALGTTALRSWIDSQNSVFVEKEKEAKVKVHAAKDKKKNLKRKLQDDLAKAVIAKNGAPLSISEHDAIISQIRSEAALAHAEIIKEMATIPAKRPRSDAVRTEPILIDVNGCAYWKLKISACKSDILFQEMKSDEDMTTENWFNFDSEQNVAIEKYISSSSKKGLYKMRC